MNSSAAFYTLTSDVENLTLTGAAAINGSGNALNNVLSGNAAGNTLDGMDGNDTLNGLAGNDVLIGGLGNDTLNGGAGADTMTGGLGNDVYEVNEAGDVVIEVAGEGTDLVNSSAAFYTLTSDVENLTLTGVAAINGSGNALGNVILGNAAANTLDGMDGNDTLRGLAGNDTLFGGAGNDSLIGGAGADIMTGGLGNDTYEVMQAGDTVIEVAGGGIDTVWTSISYSLAAEVENLFNGSVNAFTGTGNNLANRITGNAGNDTLIGGLGNDTLIGGAGADTFAYLTLADSGITAASRDVITDFVNGTDRIDLSGIDANSTVIGNNAFTFIGTSGFSVGSAASAGQLRYGFAGANTIVEGDVDGDGLADFQIQLTGIHTMTAADLVL